MEPQADDWQPNEMNPVLGTEPDAEYTKKANPSQQGSRQTQESRTTQKRLEQAVGESSFTKLMTLMLRRTMPIINIPRMVVEGQLVTYTAASGGRDFYWKLVDCNYMPLKDSITSETAHDDRQPLVGNDGKKLIKRFQPGWHFIRIVALAPVLGPATMFPETSRAQMLWESHKSDNGRPNMTKVAEIIKMFATTFPGQTDWIPSANQVKNMNRARFEAAMWYGAPTLAWLKNWLCKNIPLGKNNQNNGEKVILRVYWPITQWFIKQYCHVLGYNCLAIHSAMGADARASIKEKFIQNDGVRVVVLSYMTNSEGPNLHYNCRNSIMLEQGVHYAMEHQTWSCIRQIGQKYNQYTHRLVNMATIDRLIEAAMRLKEQLVLNAFGVIPKAVTDVDADEVYDALIGKITPQMLKSRIIGQSNLDDEAMDIDVDGS
ncbi:hypothetical protein BDD12DRAFT_808837 [Trichophaea hybrida]|nr:hypothetical protein BDD12DRAFT_808837 [Trichophaea hybrida]